MRRWIAIVGLLILACASLPLLLAPDAEPAQRAAAAPSPVEALVTSSSPRGGAASVASDVAAVASANSTARITCLVSQDDVPLAGTTLRWRSLMGDGAELAGVTDARGELALTLLARPWTAWQLEVDRDGLDAGASWTAPARATEMRMGVRVKGLGRWPDDEPDPWPAQTRRLRGPGGGVSWATTTVDALDGARLDIRLATRRTLAGRVVDAETGAGVPGATASISYADRELAAAPCGGGGAFVLDVPAPAWADTMRHHLSASAPGYAPATSRLWHLDRREPELRLRRLLRIEGRVVDERGSPVRAHVALSGALRAVEHEVDWIGPHVATTGGGPPAWRQVVECDADGRFSAEVPPGCFTHELTGPHEARVDVVVTAPGHGQHAAVHDVRPDAPLLLSLARLLPLRGRILGASGAPLSAARVTCWSWGPSTGREAGSVETDPSGAFAFDAVPAAALLGIEVAGLPERSVRVALPIDELVVRFGSAPPVIDGVVVNPRGEVVPSTFVQAHHRSWATAPELHAGEWADVATLREEWTDAAGRFTFEGLLPGTYDLVGHGGEVLLGGVEPGARDLRLVWTDHGELRFEARPAVGAGDLGSGHLVWLDGEADHPCSVASCRVPWRPALGRRVAIFAAGHRPVVREVPDSLRLGTVPLEAGGGRIAIDVDWPLRPGAQVRLVWRDPATGGRIRWSVPPPSVPRPRLVLDPVTPGDVAIDLEVDGEVAQTVRVSAREGATSTAEVDLRD